MNLKEMRAAALKAAQEITAKAKAEARDLTDEETTEVEAKLAEVADIDKKIKGENLVKSVAALGTAEPEPEGADTPAKSLGEHFVKSVGEQFKAARGVSGATVSAPEFMPSAAKANTDTQARPASAAPWATEFDTSIVTAYRRPLVVADLLGSGTLSGNSITYLIEGALEGDFTTVAEGGAKPQIHFADPTTVTETLKKLAAFVKFTDEMIEDFDFIVSNINNRALYQLSLVEENQLLSGDGTGQNLLGLLNRSGIQTETAASVTVAGDDNADAVFRAMTKIQTATGFSPDGIVIHPLDYQAFRLSKDGNGQYFGGGYFEGQYGNGTMMMQPPLWGLRTVVTAAATAGTVVVGAFQQAATVYRKGGVRVETTNSHASDFTSNLVTTRIEERLALECKFPAAVCKVTLDNDAPAGA
jgi:HK97 family phage major capsid protein